MPSPTALYSSMNGMKQEAASQQGRQALEAPGFKPPGELPQRKQAMGNPMEVFNQLAQGGNTIPLFRSLAQVGITRPDEQKLFFEYARQHGGYDAATGDFVIPKEKAAQLWESMRNDRQFQMQLNQVRINGIDQSVDKVANVIRNPQMASQMMPEEHDALAQKIDQLGQMRNALMENMQRLMGGGEQQTHPIKQAPAQQPQMQRQAPKAMEPRSANEGQVPRLTDFL